MTEADRVPFAELLADVFTYYREPWPGPGVFDVYWHGLRMYDIATVRDAFGRHAKNPDAGQFRPKLADLERMLAGSTLDAGLVAVSKFENALRHVGTYATVVFDDPLIHRVVQEMGGWVELGKIKDKDWEFRRNEFVNRYRGYRARNEIPEYPSRLIGIVDGENGDRWKEHHAWKPDQSLRLIGDPAVCAKVAAGGKDKVTPRITVGDAARLLLSAPTTKDTAS